MRQILNEWRKYLNEEEEEKRKVNIFLDMDGVLVDFPSALKEYIKSIYSVDPHVLHPGSKSSRRAISRLQSMNLSPSEIDELYDGTEHKFQSGAEYEPDEKIMGDYIFKALVGNKDLWLAMNQLEGADILVAEVFDLADEVFVLTAHVDEVSKEAKKEWIGNYFPQIKAANIYVDREKGARLRQLIKSGTVAETDLNILIDDRRKFLDDFIDSGGVGIQYDFQSPNTTFEELHGYSIFVKTLRPNGKVSSIVRNCIFRNTTRESIYIQATFTNIRIENSLFFGNRGRSVYIWLSGNNGKHSVGVRNSNIERIECKSSL